MSQRLVQILSVIENIIILEGYLLKGNETPQSKQLYYRLNRRSHLSQVELENSSPEKLQELASQLKEYEELLQNAGYSVELISEKDDSVGLKGVPINYISLFRDCFNIGNSNQNNFK